jgi:hypothetical protein
VILRSAFRWFRCHLVSLVSTYSNSRTPFLPHPKWLFATIVGALAWAQFRGFDMLDGGYYFLLYQNPSDNSDTHTRFQLMARPFWLLSGQNVVLFRLLTCFIATVACFAFWRAFQRLINSFESMILYWWPLWAAVLAGLSCVPIALTYNSFATIFLLLAIAIILSVVPVSCDDSPFRVKNWILALSITLLLYCLFLVKPPAALAFLISVYAVGIFGLNNSLWQRRLLLWIGILALVTISILIVVVSRPEFNLNRLFNIHGFVFSPAWIHDTFSRYLVEIDRVLPNFGRDILWTICPTTLVCCSAVFARSKGSVPSVLRYLVLALLLMAIAGVTIRHRLWDASFLTAMSAQSARFYVMLWCSLLPIWLLCFILNGRTNPISSRRQIVWIVVFLVLPVISSFGSTNTIYVSAMHESVFWVAGLILVSEGIAKDLSVPWFRNCICILMALGASAHVFSGHFMSPYMFQPSLWKQTQAVEIGSPSTTIKVDPALGAFLTDIRSTLDKNGYEPGDDVFGFFNLPGVIFAIGARQPGAPWYFGTWYHDDDTDGGKLRRVALIRRQRAWIITQADVSMFRPQFLKCGIDFPDGYVKIGQTMNPTTGLEIGIWKPHARD